MLNCDINSLNYESYSGKLIDLSSKCAVFAQTEIVNLIAENVAEDTIIFSVLKQITAQALQLLRKIKCAILPIISYTSSAKY